MKQPEHIAPIIERVIDTLRLSPDAPPKKFIPVEFDEQVAIFDYVRLRARQDKRWCLIFATLNGVRLPIGLARKAKRAGMIKGLPDIIALARGYAGCPGLLIELKRIKGGHVDDVQRTYHDLLRQQGYCVIVAKGAQAAVAALEKYMSGAGLPA